MKRIVSSDGRRMVEIIRRPDASFGFEAWQLSEHVRERGWLPYGRFSVCRTADADSAEREARERVDWLKRSGNAE